MRVYGDSVIVIYYLEGTPPFAARASVRLAALWAAGDVLTVSDLVRLECRVQPIRRGDAAQLADYDNLFGKVGAWNPLRPLSGLATAEMFLPCIALQINKGRWSVYE
jgi:hypothetical protein